MIQVEYNRENIKGNPDRLSGIIMAVTPTDDGTYNAIASQNFEALLFLVNHIIGSAGDLPPSLERRVNILKEQQLSDPELFDYQEYYGIITKCAESLERFLPSRVQVDIYEDPNIPKELKLYGITIANIILSYMDDFAIQRVKEEYETPPL